MLSCSTPFSAPSLWMGGGLESRCVGHVYSADGAVSRMAPSAPYTQPTQPHATMSHLPTLLLLT